MAVRFKKRVNISIDEELHEWAVSAAHEDGTDFSGLLSNLIAEFRRNDKLTRNAILNSGFS